MKFEFKDIENRWKDKWYDDNIYKAVDFSEKPKKYILVEFPYPSGKSMHVGHMMRYTLPEIYSRFLRMKGYNVMFPMGWDAFGLPAENYAIKTGRSPVVSTAELAGFYRNSMKDMGYGIDWDREVNTTDPEYYKWTQWIFTKFFEAGLAELREEPVWWSEEMKTVLAEEEVIKDENGNLTAERDGSPVEKKMLKQWVLKQPAYADKLLDGLTEDIKDLDGNSLGPIEIAEDIVAAQTNWIGRSEGSSLKFPVDGMDGVVLEAFTTRIDTLYGVTFMVIAPEHEIIDDLMSLCQNKDEVQKYIDSTNSKTELERQQEKEKSGVCMEGVFVNNPLDKNAPRIPVYLADYVLRSYGTGIVMGVPAHDERDYEFAKKFGITIIPVIATKPDQIPDASSNDYKCESEYGYVVNSSKFDGMTSEDAKIKITEELEAMGMGKAEVTYSLRDWLFSRQRYWGEPIPLIHKEDGTVEAIADSTDPDSVNANLPLVTPEVPDYNPTADGESPLAANKEWVNTTARDGSPAVRETNTMPNWAGSCWYFLRYIDPKNSDVLADMEKMKYWLPVDKYFGGSEHTTLHLLYSRFWHKFLYDNGAVPTSEPYRWRMNGGILLGPDGAKMSKSKGNVIEPREKLDLYGADAVRMYIAFIGPYNGTFPYSESSLKVCHKLVKNIYEMKEKVGEGKNDELNRKLHKMIKKVSRMAEDMKMNTIVSEYMIFVRELKSVEVIPVDIWKEFIKIISPMAVFTAEELWQEINGYTEWKPENSVHLQEWPEFDPSLVTDEMTEVPIQINGKKRGVIEVETGASEDVVKRDSY
jgi:leucyl-tRNA synthetase